MMQHPAESCFLVQRNRRTVNSQACVCVCVSLRVPCWNVFLGSLDSGSYPFCVSSAVGEET